MKKGPNHATSRRQFVNAACAAAFGVGALAYAPSVHAQTRMIISNDIPEKTLKGDTWKHLIERLKAGFPGGINVELHHSAALYSQSTQVQATQLGAVHAIAPALGIYTGSFPKLTVLALPFLLPTPEAIGEAVRRDDLGAALFAEVEKSGLKVMGVWLNGPRFISVKQKAIRTPADAVGLKIRVPGGANYVESFKAIGANVLAMNWSEVPTAIQQGVIDAVEVPPNIILSTKMYEMLPRITAVGYILDTYLVTINKRWYDGLSAEQRKFMTDAFESTAKWNWVQATEANLAAVTKIRSAGAEIIELTPSEKKAWTAAMMPVWDKVGTPLVGAEFMAKLRSVGDRHRE